MRVLYFPVHDDAATSMALLCQGANVAVDLAGVDNCFAPSRISGARQVHHLKSFGVETPSDTAIEERVRNGAYDGVIVSTPPQILQVRESLGRLRPALPLIVLHSVNRFDEFRKLGVFNFMTTSRLGVDAVAARNSFIFRKILNWGALSQFSSDPSDREGVYSYIHHYAVYWPNAWARFQKLSQSLGPNSIFNFGRDSLSGEVCDAEWMSRSRATLHLKDGGACCYAVIRSMAYGAPVVMDESTYYSGGFDGVDGVIVRANVGDVAEELKRLSTDDEYWSELHGLTCRSARRQFTYDDDLGKRFKEFLENAKGLIPRNRLAVAKFYDSSTAPNTSGITKGASNEGHRSTLPAAIARSVDLAQRKFVTTAARIRKRVQGGIPRIIHQVFLGRGPIKPEWLPWMKAWSPMNPEYDYRLWRDDECDSFVQAHDPDFFPCWKAIREDLWVVRADYIRMLVISVLGGYYFDCDVEPLQPVSRLKLRQFDCVLFREAPDRLCNAGFAATPQHSIVVTALRRIRRNIVRHILGQDKVRMDDIIERTGPVMLTETAEDFGVELDFGNGLSFGDFVLNQHRERAPDGVLVCPEAALWRCSKANFLGAHWFANSWIDGSLYVPDRNPVIRNSLSLEARIESCLANRESVYFAKVSTGGRAKDPLQRLVERYPHWRGVIIEPISPRLEDLKQRYRSTDRVGYEQVAISSRDRSQTFYHVSNRAQSRLRNLPSWHRLIGSSDRSYMLTQLGDRIDSFLETEEIESASLKTVLRKRQVPRVDLYHVDGEGEHAEVLRQIDLETDRPACLLFNHRQLAHADGDQVNRRLRKADYQVFECGDNMLAVSARS